MKQAAISGHSKVVLTLLVVLAVTGPADIYIRSIARSPSVVETVVGNSGASTNSSNFDAFLIVRRGTLEICRLQTNFVTPLDPGMAVTTFRVAAKTSEGEATYVVDVAVRFWDVSPVSDGEPSNDRHAGTFILHGTPRCTALKPPQ